MSEGVVAVTERGVSTDPHFYFIKLRQSDEPDPEAIKLEILKSLGLPNCVNLELHPTSDEYFNYEFTLLDPPGLKPQSDLYKWHRIYPTFSGADWSSAGTRFRLVRFVAFAKQRIAKLFCLFDLGRPTGLGEAVRVIHFFYCGREI
jgi:hypothetical protein